MKSAVKILTEEKAAQRLDSLAYDIISVAWLEESSAKKSPRDILNYYKILIMHKGSATVYIDNTQYYIKKGDCVLFSPGSLYHAEISDEEGCRFAAINFALSTPVQDRYFRDLIGIKDIAIYPQLASENIATSTVNIFENCFAESEGHYYQVTLLLKRLIGTIFYLGHQVTPENGIKKARNSEENTVLTCHRYIINNPSDNVTVEDLCSYCNVSQSYLYKCFSNVLGVSTKQFITATKMDITAKELLKTDKTITQIAAENGYGNSFRFSNLFKKVYGISPSQYRTKNR